MSVSPYRDEATTPPLVARAAYDVEAAITEDRPIWGAHETRNPANQWLANLKARTRNALEVADAGVQAQEFVHRELYARLPWLRYGRITRVLP